jgi:hypothetical protein
LSMIRGFLTDARHRLGAGGTGLFFLNFNFKFFSKFFIFDIFFFGWEVRSIRSRIERGGLVHDPWIVDGCPTQIRSGRHVIGFLICYYFIFSFFHFFIFSFPG